MERLNIIAIMGKLKSGKDTAGQMLLDSQKGGIRIAFADKLKSICGQLYGLTHEQMNTEEGKSTPTKLRCMRCPLCKGINCEKVKLEREWKVQCLNHLCNAVGEIDAFNDFWTPRMILQYVGTEGMRRVDPNVWVNYAMNHARTAIEEGFTVTKLSDGETRYKLGERVKAKFVVITDCRFRSEMAGVVAAGGEIWRIRRPETDSSSSGLEKHASETEMDGIPDGEFNRVIMNDGSLDDLRVKMSTSLSQFFAARSGN